MAMGSSWTGNAQQKDCGFRTVGLILTLQLSTEILWVSHFPSPSLSLLICQMGIIVLMPLHCGE